MRELGQKPREIARREGIPIRRVKGILERFPHQDRGISRKGRGRKHVLSESDRNYLVQQAKRNPFISYSELLASVENACSTETIRQHLRRCAVIHHPSLTRPHLTDAQAARRLQWCLDHRDKPLEFWRKVIFSDESTVNVSCGQRIKWVWVPKGLEVTPSVKTCFSTNTNWNDFIFRP